MVMAAGVAAEPAADVVEAAAADAEGRGASERTHVSKANHPLHIHIMMASGRLLLLLIVSSLVGIHLCMLLPLVVQTRVIMEAVVIPLAMVLAPPLGMRSASSRYLLRIQRTRSLQAHLTCMVLSITTSTWTMLSRLAACVTTLRSRVHFPRFRNSSMIHSCVQEF